VKWECEVAVTRPLTAPVMILMAFEALCAGERRSGVRIVACKAFLDARHEYFRCLLATFDRAMAADAILHAVRVVIELAVRKPSGSNACFHDLGHERRIRTHECMALRAGLGPQHALGLGNASPNPILARARRRTTPGSGNSH